MPDVLKDNTRPVAAKPYTEPVTRPVTMNGRPK
jgi:hypothetical protein